MTTKRQDFGESDTERLARIQIYEIEAGLLFVRPRGWTNSSDEPGPPKAPRGLRHKGCH